MTYHDVPTTSHQAAIANLPADAATQRKIFDDLFAARDRQREAARAAREKENVKGYESMMQERLGVDPFAIKQMKAWSDLFARDRYRGSVAFTQFVIFANAQGFSEQVEKPEDDRPVYDRTRMGRKTIGFRAEGRPTYGMTIQSVQERETLQQAEEIYQKLKAGVPANRLREGGGAGRPPKTWQNALQLAYERIEREHEEEELDRLTRPEAQDS